MLRVKAALLFLAVAVTAHADWTIRSAHSEPGLAGVVHRQASLEDSETNESVTIDLALFSTKSCTLRVIDQPAAPRGILPALWGRKDVSRYKRRVLRPRLRADWIADQRWKNDRAPPTRETDYWRAGSVAARSKDSARPRIFATTKVQLRGPVWSVPCRSRPKCSRPGEDSHGAKDLCCNRKCQSCSARILLGCVAFGAGQNPFHNTIGRRFQD